MTNKVFTFCFFLTVTTACNTSDEPDSKFISLAEFEQQVVDSVDAQATHCGKVNLGESPLVVNTCVSDSLVLNMPFYAVYIRQGIDSNIASAFTMDTNGLLTYWSYDSDISGGSTQESRVFSMVCVNPSLTLDLSDMNFDVIQCNG